MEVHVFVRRERDNAFDGRKGELDGAVVPERGVAAQALPDAPDDEVNVPRVTTPLQKGHR